MRVIYYPVEVLRMAYNETLEEYNRLLHMRMGEKVDDKNQRNHAERFNYGLIKDRNKMKIRLDQYKEAIELLEAVNINCKN